MREESKHSITFDRIRTKLSVLFMWSRLQNKAKMQLVSPKSKIRVLVFLLKVSVGVSNNKSHRPREKMQSQKIRWCTVCASNHVCYYKRSHHLFAHKLSWASHPCSLLQHSLPRSTPSSLCSFQREPGMNVAWKPETLTCIARVHTFVSIWQIFKSLQYQTLNLNLWP